MVRFKATAIARPNIAFIKYWGNYDSDLRIPNNGSISMTEDSLSTKITLEFSKKYRKDAVLVNGKKCAAGNESGPTFNTDKNGKTKNIDYYYYQSKCYGNKCP